MIGNNMSLYPNELMFSIFHCFVQQCNEEASTVKAQFLSELSSVHGGILYI